MSLPANRPVADCVHSKISAPSVVEGWYPDVKMVNVLEVYSVLTTKPDASTVVTAGRVFG